MSRPGTATSWAADSVRRCRSRSARAWNIATKTGPTTPRPRPHRPPTPLDVDDCDGYYATTAHDPATGPVTSTAYNRDLTGPLRNQHLRRRRTHRRGSPPRSPAPTVVVMNPFDLERCIRRVSTLTDNSWLTGGLSMKVHHVARSRTSPGIGHPPRAEGGIDGHARGRSPRSAPNQRRGMHQSAAMHHENDTRKSPKFRQPRLCLPKQSSSRRAPSRIDRCACRSRSCTLSW